MTEKTNDFESRITFIENNLPSGTSELLYNYFDVNQADITVIPADGTPYVFPSPGVICINPGETIEIYANVSTDGVGAFNKSTLEIVRDLTTTVAASVFTDTGDNDFGSGTVFWKETLTSPTSFNV